MKKLFYCYYYYLYKFAKIFDVSDDDEYSHNWAAQMIWFNIGGIIVFLLILLLYSLDIIVTRTFLFIAISPFLIIGFFNSHKNQLFFEYEEQHKDDPRDSLKACFAALFCIFVIIIYILTIPMLR